MDLTRSNLHSSSPAQAEYLFKLGVSYMAVGDFISATESFKSARHYFLQTAQYKTYLKIQTFLMVIYTEMEQFDQIKTVRQEITDVLWKQKNTTKDEAIFYYTLGMYYCRRNEYEQAQNYFNQGTMRAGRDQASALQQSDSLALLSAKVNMCFISYGLTYLLQHTAHRIPEAVQELNNLEHLLNQCLHLEAKVKKEKSTNEDPSPTFYERYQLTTIRQDLDKLHLASLILKANILRKEQKYTSAENLYWMCFEQSQKSCEKQYICPYLFYCMGFNYMEKKDYNQAIVFLKLAQKSARPDVFKKLSRNINHTLQKLNENIVSYDMVVNFNNKLIVEKQKGNVNFKNQFVLLDLLKLFVTQPGTIYSKEDLVTKVWKQDYDPLVHDNKIYVTIKRLRKMIEPNQEKPQYIFRKKEGYYMNKATKILLK